MAVQRYFRRERQDDIDKVLGDPRHMAPYYPDGLTDLCYGMPGARRPVGVSRFYRWRTPPVVVDFEPAPNDGRFWIEHKREFFQQRGVVFVPVFLGEVLTAAEFTKRLAEETQRLRGVEGKRTPEDVEVIMRSASMRVRIDDAVSEEWTRRQLRLTGIARADVLAKIRREVTRHMREQVADGRLGDEYSAGLTQVALG